MHWRILLRQICTGCLKQVKHEAALEAAFHLLSEEFFPIEYIVLPFLKEDRICLEEEVKSRY